MNPVRKKTSRAAVSSPKKRISIGIISWPAEDRPREKLLKQGEYKLSNSELLPFCFAPAQKAQAL